MPTQISGDTGVSAVQSGVVAQGDLAANVVGNGPAFSAYASVATSLNSGTYTKVAFQTEEFDTNNSYDSATNSRFQPNVPGYYQINAAVGHAPASGNEVTALYKNGAIYKKGAQILTTSPNGVASLVVNCLVYLNGSSDYVEIYTFQNTGGALNTATGVEFTYFQGYLVRAA